MSTCRDNVLLVDLQLDTYVRAGRQSPTKPGGQAIAFSRIRVIAADGEITDAELDELRGIATSGVMMSRSSVPSWNRAVSNRRRAAR